MTIAAALLYALASGAIQATPPGAAQTAPPSQDPDEQVEQSFPSGGPIGEASVDLGEIVVTGQRLRGSVEGDIEPELTLDSSQILAYGASNIEELLTALEPITRSGRGRSDGGPVLLVNGRRISGFREIRGIPTEAIERTEILPEEVALTYGYRADQRVVNFVLRQEFRSVTGQANLRMPTQGGRTSTELESNVFRIQQGSRWTLDIEHERDTALYETERDIIRDPGSSPFDRIGNVSGSPFGTEIDPALSALAGSSVLTAPVPTANPNPSLADFAAGADTLRTDDLTAFRTLLPRQEEMSIEGSLSRDLNQIVQVTISGTLSDTSSVSFLGLPGVTLTLPEDNLYSPFSQDVNLYRYIDRPDALRRRVDTLTAESGVVLDGFLGDWRWTATGGYSRVQTDTRTGRGLDASGLQSALDANDSGVNPFADLPFDRLTTVPTDTARSVTTGANAEVVLTGDLWEGPAGDLSSTFTFGANTQQLESESLRMGVASERTQSRDRATGQGSFTLPIASRDREVLAGLGDLSVNFNLGYEEASDFGGLPTFGLGANWTPIEPLSFIVSYTDEQGAPTIQQLNDPVVTTPNVPVFDIATGQTVSITRIDGGNPALLADNRKVLKLGVNLKPFSERDLTLSSNYTLSTTDDAITAFPTITPDLEAALPERFTRDADGTLLSIDARPLNFTRSERQELRSGFNFSRAFGTPTPPEASAGVPGEGRPGGGGRRGGGAFAGGGPGGGGPGAGGPRGGGRGGGMQPGQGRFNLSVYHTWRLQDEIVIRDGLAALDLLDGAATGARGGNPRHEVQVQGGVFRRGVGAFVNANWRGSTRIDGGLTGGPDLDFADQTTINLNVFADLSSRPDWVERFPWLKGARINLGVENLFDTRLDVTSSDGQRPINYQPDFLDPQGRVFRIGLRKILF